jgi:hypothetical protein
MSSFLKNNLMEYFVLIDPAGNPLQVFGSLLECFSWRPAKKFYSDPVIHRIHYKPDGILAVQVIQVGKDNFNPDIIHPVSKKDFFLSSVPEHASDTF